MKINTSAWHYKLQDLFNLCPNQRTNLCAYMRGVFSALAIVGLITVILLFILSLMTSVFWGWFTAIEGAVMFWGFILWILLAFGSSAIYKESYATKDTFWFKDITLPKNKSIFPAWFKSLKDKTCPLVEFDDE